jgi:hypothetical protein
VGPIATSEPARPATEALLAIKHRSASRQVRSAPNGTGILDTDQIVAESNESNNTDYAWLTVPDCSFH